MSDLSGEELINNMSIKDEADSFPELSPTNFPELSPTNSEAKDEIAAQSPVPASKTPWGDGKSMAEVAAAAHRREEEHKLLAREHRKSADSGYKTQSRTATSSGISVTSQSPGPIPTELQSRLQAIALGPSSPDNDPPPTHEDLQAEVKALRMELQVLKAGPSRELVTPPPDIVHHATEAAISVHSSAATPNRDEWETLPAAKEEWKHVDSRSPRVSREADRPAQVAASSAPKAAGDDDVSRSRQDKERERKRAQRQRRRRAARQAKATDVLNEDKDSAAVAEDIVDDSGDDQEEESGLHDACEVLHRGWWAAATAFFSGQVAELRR